MYIYSYFINCLSTKVESENKIIRIGEYFEDEYHTLYLEDGIIHGTYKPKIRRIDLKLAKKLVSDRKIVSNGKTYPVLADLYKAVAIDKDARNYFSSKESIEGLSAVGVLVSNQIAKFGATIWNMINEPAIPTKIFTNKEKAIKWLQQFRYMN